MKRTKIQIPLDKGRIMMGTSDETRTLEQGQVFIQYSKETHLPGKNVIVVEGDVVVTKNPCFHEGDIRVLQAVNVPSLSHMVDCIVFPQVGQRPHPDEMSGSDLDGDMYFVCWDEQLCKFKNHKPMDFPKAEKKRLEREVESHDIIDFLAEYIRYDKLGLIANAHLVHSDSNKNGIFSEECHKLAQMHSEAVDFPKTGITPKFDYDLRPKCYPDFMMKKDKQIYSSRKIIGKLFRQCRSIRYMQNRFKLKLESDMEFLSEEIDKKTMNNAEQQKNLYRRRMSEVLDLYGIKSEAEGLSGLPQKVSTTKGYLREEKYHVGQIVKEKISMIQKRTREEFFEEFGGDSHEKLADRRVIAKALAWYTVTYTNEVDSVRPILSFPWIVADVLVTNEKPYLHNQESRLDGILTEYYDATQTDRNHEKFSLNLIKEKFRRLLWDVHRENVECISLGLECSGILNGQQTFNIAIKGLQLHEIEEKMTKQGIIKTSEDPCYILNDTEIERCNVRIINDGRIVTLSSTLQEYLSKARHLKPVTCIQCLQELLRPVLQGILPVDSKGHHFCDLVAALIVCFSLSRAHSSMVTNAFPVKPFETEYGKNLLFVLKNFILCSGSFNNDINTMFKDGLNALGMDNFNHTNEIAKALFLVYQQIAQYPDVTIISLCQSVKDLCTDPSPDMFEESEHYGVFNLPITVVGSAKFVVKYLEYQVSTKSGADVLFYNNKKKLNKFEAWGKKKAHQKISALIETFSMKGGGELSSEAKKGHVVVNEAYSVIFQGGCNESELLFEKYNGPCQEMHENREMYLPKITKPIDSKEMSFWEDFEEKFIQQWATLKSEYIDLVHGDISMIISFGIFYVMNVQQNKGMNVSKLNRLFTNISQRKKELEKKKEKKINYKTMPYTFSFQPVVHQNTDTICDVLKNLGFLYSGMETNISIRIGGKDLVVCHFRENGYLWTMNFSDTKWGIITVVPKSSQDVMQPTNIRFRLQSFKYLNREVFGLIKEYKPLVESKPMFRITPDGYILDAFFHDQDILYAREKVTKIYRNLDSNDDLSQSLKVEVSRVTELKLNDEKTKLIRSASSRVEVNLCPSLPSLKSLNNELKSYSRYILDKALILASRFDVI